MALSTCTARGGESEPRGGKCSPPPPPERNPACIDMFNITNNYKAINLNNIIIINSIIIINK